MTLTVAITATQGGAEAVSTSPSIPSCDHGERSYKEGGNGRKTWQAWFCKRRICDPLWVTTGQRSHIGDHKWKNR